VTSFSLVGVLYPYFQGRGISRAGKQKEAGYLITLLCCWGHAVALLVEALWYKLEGRRFESRMRWIMLNFPNPSSRTMALGLTQHLTEMSTRNLPGAKKRPAPRADNLAAIYEPNV
jgi:hypothetical protein